MNKLEAETKKQFEYKYGRMVTAWTKIAYAINTEWYYSYHWKPETWIEQAKKDLQTRMIQNANEYNSLKEAEELLYSIK